MSDDKKKAWDDARRKAHQAKRALDDESLRLEKAKAEALEPYRKAVKSADTATWRAFIRYCQSLLIFQPGDIVQDEHGVKYRIAKHLWVYSDGHELERFTVQHPDGEYPHYGMKMADVLGIRWIGIRLTKNGIEQGGERPLYSPHLTITPPEGT